MPDREKIIASLKYFSRLNDKKIDWQKVDLDSIVLLDHARGIAGVPFQVTSNYRTPEHSVAVGGFKDDEHTIIPVECFDILCARANEKWDSQKAFLMIGALMRVGFTRIGINFKNKSVHAGRNKSFPQNVLFIE